jgi:hypothetical protein
MGWPQAQLPGFMPTVLHLSCAHEYRTSCRSASAAYAGCTIMHPAARSATRAPINKNWYLLMFPPLFLLLFTGKPAPLAHFITGRLHTEIPLPARIPAAGHENYRPVTCVPRCGDTGNSFNGTGLQQI